MAAAGSTDGRRGLDLDVQIIAAGPGDLPTLEALMQLYAYDFSAILGLDVAEDGRFDAPSLEAYRNDGRRHAFLIREGATLAGFALVHDGSRLTGDPAIRDMAELDDAPYSPLSSASPWMPHFSHAPPTAAGGSGE